MMTESYPYMVTYIVWHVPTPTAYWSKISVEMLDHVHKAPSEAWTLPTFWLGFEGLDLMPENTK